MTQKLFPCKQCGAEVDFKPGSDSLCCGHCGFENPIPESEAGVAELDFEASLGELERRGESHEQITVKCTTCSAETTLAANQTASECPFCGSNIVATGAARTLIRPKALLPFKVTRDQALDAFRGWLRSRWFAPGRLKRIAGADSSLSGMYVPYWTYDCDTTSDYRGERGDDYWVTESYTALENGKTVHKTRQVRKTRWTSVSGVVQNSFDDLLVLASRSLPGKSASLLEPWDLTALVPYQDEYLSGFRAESYQVDLKEGFSIARGMMDGQIRLTVCRDIGGDHQRISSLHVRYRDITFKHLLLPVWMSAYRLREKVYHFLVNARTGEVQGERPWSGWKIFGLVLLILAIAAAIAAGAGLFSSR